MMKNRDQGASLMQSLLTISLGAVVGIVFGLVLFSGPMAGVAISAGLGALVGGGVQAVQGWT